MTKDLVSLCIKAAFAQRISFYYVYNINAIAFMLLSLILIMPNVWYFIVTPEINVLYAMGASVVIANAIIIFILSELYPQLVEKRIAKYFEHITFTCDAAQKNYINQKIEGNNSIKEIKLYIKDRYHINNCNVIFATMLYIMNIKKTISIKLYTK